MEKTLESEARIENINEFLSVTQEFDRMNQDDFDLTAFLTDLALVSDLDQIEVTPRNNRGRQECQCGRQNDSQGDARQFQADRAPQAARKRSKVPLQGSVVVRRDGEDQVRRDALPHGHRPHATAVIVMSS